MVSYITSKWMWLQNISRSYKVLSVDTKDSLL